MNPLHHQEIFPNDGMQPLLVLYPSVVRAAAAVAVAEEEEEEEAVLDDSMILHNEEPQNVVSQQRQKQQQEQVNEALLHNSRVLQPEDDEDAFGEDDEDDPTLDKEPPVEINVQSPSISAYPTESGTPPADAPYGEAPSFGDDGGGGNEGQPQQPAIAPADGYSDYPPRPAPAQGDDKSSTAASNNANGGDKGGPSPFLVLVVFIAALVALLIGYRAYKKYQRKREQHLMNLRSAQADQVLGDMQMIPSEDPDQELL